MGESEGSELSDAVIYNTLTPPTRHFAPRPASRPALRFAHRSSRIKKTSQAKNLGTFMYDSMGGKQEFKVHEEKQPPFRTLTVMIIQGGKEGLCLQRLLVHGKEG